MREGLGKFDFDNTISKLWIDTTRRDSQDGEVGLVGYEINFNRYFYEYRPPRPLLAPDEGQDFRGRRARGHLHRPEDADCGGEDGLPGELPAEPRAGVPALEG